MEEAVDVVVAEHSGETRQLCATVQAFQRGARLQLVEHVSKFVREKLTVHFTQLPSFPTRCIQCKGVNTNYQQALFQYWTKPRCGACSRTEWRRVVCTRTNDADLETPVVCETNGVASSETAPMSTENTTDGLTETSDTPTVDGMENESSTATPETYSTKRTAPQPVQRDVARDKRPKPGDFSFHYSNITPQVIFSAIQRRSSFCLTRIFGL